MKHHTKTSGAPRNIARAVVAKAADVFFLSEPNAEVPAGNQDGFGLYYHDCRYLDGYRIRLAGTAATVLVSAAGKGSITQFELTNEELHVQEGKTIPAQTFGLRLQRVIDGNQLAVHDVITIDNYDVQAHELPLSLEFESRFEDIFEIRGLNPKKTGRENKPEWHDGVLVLSYSGADGVLRRTEIHFDPAPAKTSAKCAEYQLNLRAGQQEQLKISFQLVETRERPPVGKRAKSNANEVVHGIDRASHKWLSGYAEVHSNSIHLNRVMQRSLLDLGILKSELDGHHYFSAGLPWYGALFGRDSIISALQTLAYEPGIAENTIRLLAKYQGRKNEGSRDEEPGKILHELRRGELANLNEIPQTPYYGSVDSTPLFLILVGEHANWTGDINLFKDIGSNIEQALHWIDHGGATPEGRYLSYASKSSKGLGNQGWKDSGVSVMNSDGSLAKPPIALVEVQGYVYRAKLLMADLYGRIGDNDTATRLRNEAAELKRDFNRDFWLESKNFYAIALQKEGKPAAVISSNPGQALWSGIVDDDKAEAVVQQLTAEDMFSGWGIRTLSHKERRYNPIGYHLGTVWPHDNSIIAAGLRRYGFDKQALQILESIVAAGQYFEHARLPEVFGGFSQHDFAVPVKYPVACHPQAWAAGSVPFMISSLLGLTADAFNRRLRVIRPMLPSFVNELDIRRVKIGDSLIDLRFEATRAGEVQVEVVKNSGSIKVDVEQGQERLEAA
ncbi:MAG TPA: glycogen debranching N-terminal domain-containing protein [Candidatus Angelobacter sp.]|nr:glycogen debranching N-terminal domain-containing protein [Candidatus Angelobacter sp.]